MTDANLESEDREAPDGVDGPPSVDTESTTDPIVDSQIDEAIRRAESVAEDDAAAESPEERHGDFDSDLDGAESSDGAFVDPDPDPDPVDASGDASTEASTELPAEDAPTDTEADILDQAVERSLNEAEANGEQVEPDGQEPAPSGDASLDAPEMPVEGDEPLEHDPAEVQNAQDIEDALADVEGLASDLEDALDPELEAQLDHLVAHATSVDTAEPRPEAGAETPMDIQQLDALLAEEAVGIEGEFETVGEVVPELAAQIDAALDEASPQDGASAEDLARELDAETAEIDALSESDAASPPPMPTPDDVPQIVGTPAHEASTDPAVVTGEVGKHRLLFEIPRRCSKATRTTLAVLNTPARRLSPEMRDTVGWAILVVTGFNMAFAIYGILMG